MEFTAFTNDLLYFAAVVLGDVIRLFAAGLIGLSFAAALVFVTAFMVKND